ncbi:MAG TPA: hypothetical protein VI636_12025 [Candidatus Angelobacter sp.]
MSATTRVTPADFAPPAVITRFRAKAVLVGILAAAVAVIWGFQNPKLFLQAYLVGFMFWLGVSLGSLALLNLQYTTGGHWGALGRRFWEAATSSYNLLLLFVLWLPLVFGMKVLYPWATMKPEELLEDRQAYWLNPKLFVVRGVIYFALWWFWAWRLRRWAEREEKGNANPQRFVSIQNFSGAGVVVYGLTITFASVDWVMSLNPMWWSTVWGMLFMVGECLTAFAFTIWLLARLSQTEPLSRIVKPDHFHDYGKLMFAFVVLWAYLSFSQWLIIWQGNITEEIRWYLDRAHGHWKVIAIFLIFFHFVLPFSIMLSRSLKRQPRKLVRMAMWIMIVRVVDLFWLVQPSFHAKGVSGDILAPLNWQVVSLNVINILAIGGLWLGVFYWQLGKRSLMPVNDPEFIDMLESKHG